MSAFTTGVSGFLMIVVLLASLALSGLFAWFGFRMPTKQGKLTCAVLSLMSLLPIFFVVLLATAVQGD